MGSVSLINGHIDDTDSIDEGIWVIAEKYINGRDNIPNKEVTSFKNELMDYFKHLTPMVQAFSINDYELFSNDEYTCGVIVIAWSDVITGLNTSIYKWEEML